MVEVLIDRSRFKVLVRDSENKQEPAQQYTYREWDDFVTSVKLGQHDL
jgi:hypothetical protein